MTQGSKAITTQQLTVDASEPFPRWVRIVHDAPGVPAIDASDFDGETIYDRFYFEPGAELAGTLHAGQAIGASTWRYRAHSTPLAFAGNETSFVWLLVTGKPAVTTTIAAPETGALLLWEVTTDAAAVAAVVDRRTYATASRELSGRPGRRLSRSWSTTRRSTLIRRGDEIPLEMVQHDGTPPRPLLALKSAPHLGTFDRRIDQAADRSVRSP